MKGTFITLSRGRVLLCLCAVTLMAAVLDIPTQADSLSSGTLYVSPAGSDSNDCLSAGTACLTINAAIGKATASDTLLVAAGNYTETVDINKNLTLVGAGTGMTQVGGDGQTNFGRAMVVESAVTATISSMTVHNGRLNNAANGAGILNNGTLTITNSDVNNNLILTAIGAVNGGGIYNAGILTLVDSNVGGNGAGTGFGTATGGGIYNLGTLTVIRSSVSGNVAGSQWGSAYGGGIANFGQVLVLDSTIAGNGAGGSSGNGRGGGLYNATALNLVTLRNVTLARNLAGNGGSGQGAGLYIANGTVLAHNTLIADNSQATCTLQPDNTLQCTINAAVRLDCVGNLTSSGYNLIGDGTNCTLIGSSNDLVGTNLSPIDPLLGLLALNSGTTYSLELLPHSPAIDAGENTDCPAVDQRGIRRPIDGNNDGVATCDIGAFEAQLHVFIPIVQR